MCGRRAKVENKKDGRKIEVRIPDKCAGCKINDIDLSPTAFKALGVDLGVGRFKVRCYTV